LSGRGLCDELITRPEESYRLCCVVVCDLEKSRMGGPYIYDISRLRVNLGTRWNKIISFKQQPFYPRGKLPRCSMYKKLRGFQFRSGGFGERKTLVPIPGIGQQFLGCPTHSLMTILSYPDSNM